MTAIEKERTIIIDDIVISLSEDKYVELMGVLYPGFVYGEDFSSTMHRWCVSRLNSYIRCQITEAGLNCKVF